MVIKVRSEAGQMPWQKGLVYMSQGTLTSRTRLARKLLDGHRFRVVAENLRDSSGITGDKGCGISSGSQPLALSSCCAVLYSPPASSLNETIRHAPTSLSNPSHTVASLEYIATKRDSVACLLLMQRLQLQLDASKLCPPFRKSTRPE